MARHYIETYGCILNRGKSRAIESVFRDADHYHADGPEEADVAIMSAYTVVGKTERNILRRARELATEMADFTTTGCMALAQDNDFREKGIDTQILHRDDVPAVVTNGECPAPGPDVEPVSGGVVGILPVTRDCMSNCLYCITKFTTSQADPLSVNENVKRARALVHTGTEELRITG